MFLKIVGIFAEFERENLAERVRLGMERKAKEGYSLCCFTPSFGYNREVGNKIQEIDNSEAETVRRIFDMFLHDDCNYTKIADTLNIEQIATKLNKKWNATAIKNVLINPNYVGKIRYAVTDSTRYFEAAGQHQAIIDETTYYQTQEKIGKIGRISYTKHPTSGVYFCGVLYCEICGDKFTSHWGYKKKKQADGRKPAGHPSYRCMNATKKCCTSKYIAHGRVERAFEDYLTNYEDINTSDNCDVI